MEAWCRSGPLIDIMAMAAFMEPLDMAGLDMAGLDMGGVDTAGSDMVALDMAAATVDTTGDTFRPRRQDRSEQSVLRAQFQRHLRLPLKLGSCYEA